MRMQSIINKIQQSGCKVPRYKISTQQTSKMLDNFDQLDNRSFASTTPQWKAVNQLLSTQTNGFSQLQQSGRGPPSHMLKSCRAGSENPKQKIFLQVSSRLDKNKAAQQQKEKPNFKTTRNDSPNQRQKTFRTMSTKAENLLNKFKSRMNMAGQELISESSDSDLSLNSSENLDQIVSNNRETYLTRYQPKSLKKRLEQLDPLSHVKKTDSKQKKEHTNEKL